MPKLVAIGDSLTQGVQSGAAFETLLSYPALIAEAMGLDVPNDFRVPTFAGEGLPLNIEWLLHSMGRKLGKSINWFEWRFEVPLLLADRFDRTEDMYERGPGSRRTQYSGIHHNLAVSGFRVFDSFNVHDNYCACQINRKEGWIEDDFLGLPSASMYRIAQHVLNPGDIEERRTSTQIANLRELHENEGGVENLILFLGANDCLGAVKDLEIRRMTNDVPSDVPSDPEKRRDYNLTCVEMFASNYKKMVKLISEAIPPSGDSPPTKVFVGTIPRVTIPPIIRGIGDRLEKKSRYFQYYAPFFIQDDDFDPGDRHLTGEQVWKIDQQISKFNEKIIAIVQNQHEDPNQHGEWYHVDICGLLDDLAVRRISDAPEYASRPLRNLLAEVPEHPLLGLRPIPSVRLFESSNSKWTGGGLFSLDCFHPTTIGYGLIAEAFLDKMNEKGVNIGPAADNSKWNRLNWKRLIDQDTLIQEPPALWDDVVEAARRNPRLAKLIYGVFS